LSGYVSALPILPSILVNRIAIGFYSLGITSYAKLLRRSIGAGEVRITGVNKNSFRF
jgi:hypothetical protein